MEADTTTNVITLAITLNTDHVSRCPSPVSQLRQKPTITKKNQALHDLEKKKNQTQRRNRQQHENGYVVDVVFQREDLKT